MDGSFNSSYKELDKQPKSDQVKYNKSTLWKLAINSSFAGFILGYQYGCFNISQGAVQDELGWGGNSLLYTTIASVLVPIGAMCGAMTGGKSSEWGRRKYLIYNDLISVFGCVINVIPTTYTFMIGRFIGGFTCGAGAAVAPLYNAEYSPNKMRGVLGNVFQMQVNAGVLIGFAFCLPTLWLQWWLYLVFAFPCVPALLQIIFFKSSFKYEPATWSMKKEKLDDALAAISQVYYPDFVNKKYERELLKSTEMEETGASISQLLCNRKYSKEMSLGCLMAAFQNLSGANLIIFYSTVMFTQGGNTSLAPYLTVAVGCVQVISGACSLPLMNKSRRPLFYVGYFGLFLLFVLIAIMALLNVALVARIVFVMLWIVCFALGPCPVTWTYLGEILSDKAASVATTCNMLANITVVASSNYLLTYLGIPITFFIYAGVNFVACLYSAAFVVETNNQGKADIRMASFSYN